MATASTARGAAFLLLFRNGGPETHEQLTAEQRADLTRRWNDWYDGLAAQGKVEHGQPLELEGRVVSGANGARLTEGPYAETKEIVAGYFFLRVADLDEATEIARQCPGLPLGVTVEVRPIARTSPVLKELHGRPPNADARGVSG